MFPRERAIGVSSLLLYGIAVMVLIAAMLVISFLLGEHHRGHATNEPFESGVPLIGSARVDLTAKFYMVAMFFVIFDLESVFIVAWAVAARQLAWGGYAEILLFVGILVAVLVYLWRRGALDWGPRKR